MTQETHQRRLGNYTPGDEATPAETPSIDDVDKPWRHEAILRELYVDQRLSLREAAERLDCSPTAVRDWLDKYGIERRDTSAAYGITADSPLRDEDELRELYLDQRLSQKEIAKQLDCHKSAVLRWLDRFGIETRDISEANGVPADSPLRDEQRLRELYVDRRLSQKEIAERLDCGRSTVSERLDKHGIETREIGMALSGEHHPRWNPDRIDNYGPSWTAERRRSVRERDDFECQDSGCGMTQSASLDEHGCKLHVHHLKKASEFDDHEARNAPENLITLCPSCHNNWERLSDTGLRPQIPGVTDG